MTYKGKGTNMKKVFSNNDQVIHVWAQRTQHVGYNPKRSLSFNGDTLYSYATPIAEFVPAHKACLISSKSYSNTTAKHIPNSSDIPDSWKVFYVPHLKSFGGWDKGYDGNFIQANMRRFEQGYAETMKRLGRCRQATIPYIIDSLKEQAKDAKVFAAHFKVKFHASRFPLPSKSVIARIKVQTAEEIKAKAEETRQTNARIAAERAVELKAWRAGKAGSLHGHSKIYLRIKGENVQTSRGAEFPVKAAKLAVKLITRCVAKGELYVRQHGESGVELGQFRIDTIESNGNVKAGCHYVEFDEIQRLAKRIL